MRIALRIVSIIATLLLLFVIAVALSWWLLPDEELDPAAVDFAVRDLPPPTDSNAYFMLWGFTASPELDAHAVGRRIVADHDRLLAAQKGLQDFDQLASAYRGETPRGFPTRQRFCLPQREHCLQVLVDKAEAINASAALHKVYLERYRQLRDYEEFGFPMSQLSLDSPMPNWVAVLEMSELVDGAVAQGVMQPQSRQAALEELAAEVGLWKRLLQGDYWLTTRMISVLALHHKYQLTADILNRFPEVAVQYPALLQAITEPVPAAAATLDISLRAEYTTAFSVLGDPEQAREYAGYSANMFNDVVLALGGFRLNATINQTYRLHKQAVEFYATHNSPRALLADDAAFIRELKQQTAFTLATLFTEAGGRLDYSRAMLASGDWALYLMRIHYLIGHSRLLDTQRRLIVEQVPAERINTALAGWSPQLDDPFNEQPMQWDAATNVLFFPYPEYLESRQLPFEKFASITLEHLQR